MGLKGVFEQSLDNMLEMDRGLDINDMLDSIPAIEPEEKSSDEDGDEKEKNKDTDVSLEDINTVLNRQDTNTVKDDETVDDVVEKVDDKDDTAPATNVDTTETSSAAPFTVIFAKDLVEQGLVSSFDEEKFLESVKSDGEATALRNLIRDEIEANIEVAKSDLDLGYQEYLNLIGKGVPVETAGTLVELKNQFESIKLDELEKEENVDLRKKVLTDYFKLTTSMSDSKIDKLVQNSIDLGDDIDDSKEYLNTLKKLVKEQVEAEEEIAKQHVELRKEENRRTLESLKESINSVSEIIPGVGINKQTKVKMYETLTKEVMDSKGRITNTLWAKRAEDPIFFDSRLAYLYETGFFDKDKTWTKAAQSKITKEVSALEKAIKQNTSTKTGSPVLRSLEQEKTLKDNIDSMRGIFGR